MAVNGGFVSEFFLVWDGNEFHEAGCYIDDGERIEFGRFGVRRRLRWWLRNNPGSNEVNGDGCPRRSVVLFGNWEDSIILALALVKLTRAAELHEGVGIAVQVVPGEVLVG